MDKAQLKTFEEFHKHVQAIHKLQTIPFTTWYTDMHGDLLPINNDDNFLRAVTTARPLLRVFVQRKGTQRKILIVYYFKNGYLIDFFLWKIAL